MADYKLCVLLVVVIAVVVILLMSCVCLCVCVCVYGRTVTMVDLPSTVFGEVI